MNPRTRRARTAPPTRLACAVVMPMLIGCQTYEPIPLDITEHRAELEQRAQSTEPIDDFIRRLDESASEVPDRFSFEDGISPAEGEVLALFYNPDLRIQRLEAGVALATFETAGLWDDPVFGFDGAEIWNPSSPFEYGLMLSFTIPVSGRLEVEKARASDAYEAQLRAVVDREWSTRARVRDLWAHWTAAIERANIRRELISELERITALTGELQEVGELSRADARVFTVALANQRADLIDVEAKADDLQAELLYLLGLPMDVEIRIDLGFTPITLPDLTADLDARIIERNTTLATRRAQYQTAEQTLRLEIRKQLPDIQIGSGYGSENDDRLLLGVSIPIPILNANKPAIAEARAARELARALAETTYERLSRDLTRAVIEYRQAAARRNQIEARVISLASEQLAELQRLAELGEVDTFLLFESLASLFEAKVHLLDLKLDENSAAIRIVELLGPESPGQPSPVSSTPRTFDERDGATAIAKGDDQ